MNFIERFLKDLKEATDEDFKNDKEGIENDEEDIENEEEDIENDEIKRTGGNPFFNKLKEFFNLDGEGEDECNFTFDFDDDGETIKNIDDSQYKISQKEAFEIANLNRNLKSDFVRNVEDCITYLLFKKYATDITTINGKKYWNVKVLEADYSTIEDDEFGTIFSDGTYREKYAKEKLNKLSCLIDVDTGEYKYYPL